MSKVDGWSSFPRRKPPHRVIIAHGEAVRSFTVRPWMIASCAAVALTFSAVYLSATGYLFFRDDLLAASLARSSHMQRAYEDRIAALRADIDRLTSRQLLDQQSVEATMDKLSDRQAALDARQDVIAGISQAIRRAGLDAVITPKPVVAPPPAPAVKDPMKTSGLAPAKAASSLFGFASPAEAAPGPGDGTPELRLAALDQSLDQLATEQVAYVDDVARQVTARTGAIATVLRGIGQSVPTRRSGDAVGGPFVPLDMHADPETFRATAEILNAEIERFATVRRLVDQLPLTQPLNNAVITSGFGARMDPFLGEAAVHTGIDFRAASGTPARATAGGTVIAADYTGGYGNMVEIDHGNGVTTRYGHLSRIDVTIGQVVAKGTVVGQTGSTGRSTGPHLHYEVRVDGAPIDPITFLNAGSRLASLM